MLQELFRIPYLDFPVYGYGLMLVLGVLLAVELAKFLARRSNIDPEIFATAGLIALATGVLGARLSHVLENWHEFTNPSLTAWQNFLNMINIRSGGLTYYGGLILAFPATLFYGMYRKVDLRKGMDIIAPCLVLALGIGRIGCFLNGCCYGADCNVPWAIRFPYRSIPFEEQFARGKLALPSPKAEALIDPETHFPRPLSQLRDQPELLVEAASWRSNPVHPAQLYSTITSLMICAILLCYFTLPHPRGRVMALMFLLEGPSRFLLEMLRVEPTVWGPFSLSMVLGLIFGVLGIVLWFVFGKLDQCSPHAPSL